MRLHRGTFAVASFAIAALFIGTDRGPTSAFHDLMRPYDPWLQLATFAGDGLVLIPLCLLVWGLLTLKKHPERKAPLGALVCLLSSGLVTTILKMVIGRPRPYTDADARYLHLPVDMFHWFTMNRDFESFPSGHSTAIFAAAWFVVLRYRQRTTQAIALGLAACVALTRVALYKHYFADTLAGAAVGIGVSELVVTLFGLDGRPPLIKRLKRVPPSTVATVLALLFLLPGCSGVSSRIHEHEAEFATFPPETQAQIQSGRIDRDFTEDMVYMAKGEPSEKSTETRNGRAITVWKYASRSPLPRASNASTGLSTPYGYPGIATGPVQPAPMSYDTSYFKVEFEHGKVIGWDDGMQTDLPADLKMPETPYK